MQDYSFFINTAYLITFVVLAITIVLVVWDAKAQHQRLSVLEAKGMKRRSEKENKT